MLSLKSLGIPVVQVKVFGVLCAELATPLAIRLTLVTKLSLEYSSLIGLKVPVGVQPMTLSVDPTVQSNPDWIGSLMVILPSTSKPSESSTTSLLMTCSTRILAALTLSVIASMGGAQSV